MKLWNEFYFQLSDDIRRCKDNHSEEVTLYKTLLLIDDQLKAHGQTLHSFPRMSELFATVPSNIHVSNIIEEELSYCTQELCIVVSDHEKKMNEDQIRVYNTVIQAVFQPHPNPHFFSGWTRRYWKDICLQHNFSKNKIYW